MKTHTFSVVVGDQTCNARCPYCVAQMTAAGFSDHVDFDQGRFDIACRIVEQMREGLLTVLLTGQGEPMLFPKQINRYMDCINHRFPKIELQTNGTLVDKQLDNLARWRDNGLTLVCISVAHPSAGLSNALMGIKVRDYDYWKTVTKIQQLGLGVRLNCTMTDMGVCETDTAETLIAKASNADVDQVTFREVEMPTPCYSASIGAWVGEHKPEGAAKKLHHYLEMKGAVRLLELPHGGIVYDYEGQNVCVSNCLTGTTNPDNIRQIIFFPDGRIAYDWRYRAARIM